MGFFMGRAIIGNRRASSTSAKHEAIVAAVDAATAAGPIVGDMPSRRAGRDSKGGLNPCAARLRRYRAMLEPLGLWESFAALPLGWREGFARLKYPDPRLEFDQPVVSDPRYRELRRRLEKNFAESTIDFYGSKLAARDFFPVLIGVMNTAGGCKNQPNLPPACAAFAAAAHTVLLEFHREVMDKVWAAWREALIVPLVQASRLDGTMLGATLRQDFSDNGKFIIIVRIGAQTLETRSISLDGAARPVVRVGSSCHWDGVRAASFRGRPVFAQSHALRQLRTRLNVAALGDYLEAWLAESLMEERTAEDFDGATNQVLVEYRIREQLLGYLVLSLLEDVAVVRTFLFLTMEGTPQGRRLRARLRVSRRDVDWLGLSELSTFTQTDLRSDPVMRPILDSCGCGHLFELDYLGAAAPGQQPKAVAAEMRRYLRMAA
jgi:hypothetical protein